MKTTDFRALSSQAQEEIREKAVKAAAGGLTQEETANLFGITRQAVCGWVKAQRKGGAKALKAKKRGRPAGGKLNTRQAAQIAHIVIDRNPDQLKLPFYLWTREAVGGLIERKFDIRLSVWTVGRYLKSWGFTPQKPIRRAFEQNKEEVRRWLKEEYPLIKRRAKAEKAQIYWGDEMGLRSDHAAGTSFSLKGKTPVIMGTGKRFGCNMISAITNRGRMYFMVFKSRFYVKVFIDFIGRMKRQLRNKIFLIVDSHPVHRSRKVKEWLKANKQRFEMFFLPGYSPELNPDELLNQDVKSNALGRKRARHQDELVNNIRGYLKGRQRQPKIIKGFFQEEHVRYAAM